MKEFVLCLWFRDCVRRSRHAGELLSVEGKILTTVNLLRGQKREKENDLVVVAGNSFMFINKHRLFQQIMVFFNLPVASHLFRT